MTPDNIWLLVYIAGGAITLFLVVAEEGLPKSESSPLILAICFAIWPIILPMHCGEIVHKMRKKRIEEEDKDREAWRESIRNRGAK